MNNPIPLGDKFRHPHCQLIHLFAAKHLPLLHQGLNQNLFQNRFPSRGMTLVEVLICLSIAMIVTTLGATSVPSYLEKRVESVAFDTLFHLVTFARTKAIREQELFTLCASNDGINCNGEWNQQIIVFNDNNKNARRDNSEILYKMIAMPSGTPCLEWNVGLNRRYLRFKPDGSNAGTAGHFRPCDTTKSLLQKKLVVSFAGRTSIKDL